MDLKVLDRSLDLIVGQLFLISSPQGHCRLDHRVYFLEGDRCQASKRGSSGKNLIFATAQEVGKTRTQNEGAKHSCDTNRPRWLHKSMRDCEGTETGRRPCSRPVGTSLEDIVRLGRCGVRVKGGPEGAGGNKEQS